MTPGWVTPGGISSTTSGIGNVEKRHQLLLPKMLLMWIPGTSPRGGERVSNKAVGVLKI